MLFIHSSVDCYLGCFHFLAIVISTAMNICVQVFMRTYVFNSLEYIPRSGISGSHLLILKFFYCLFLLKRKYRSMVKKKKNSQTIQSISEK